MRSNRQELESVYDQFGHQLFVCALAITGNGDLAEDAIHDAFCRAFGNPRNPINLKAYMFQCVRHAAIDIVRKSNRFKLWTAETVGQGTKTTPLQDLETDDLFEQVLSAMKHLKEVEREIVLAHLVGDMKFREIAETRQLPLGTVTAHYHRAMHRLRSLLEKFHGSARKTNY